MDHAVVASRHHIDASGIKLAGIFKLPDELDANNEEIARMFNAVGSYGSEGD